jgi:hypothetical protein
VTFVAGVVIVAVGGWFALGTGRRTNVAVEGTPAEFKINSM